MKVSVKQMRWRFATALLLAGCTVEPTGYQPAQPLHEENGFLSNQLISGGLSNLPSRARPIRVAVYAIPDKSGAHKQGSNFAEISTALTQGAEALVMDALSRAGRGRWFQLVERTELSAVLNERKLITAQDTEARQRAHTQAERRRIAKETAEIDAEVAALRAKVQREYDAVRNSDGNVPANMPSFEQTLLNLENYANKRRAAIAAEKPFSSFEGPASVRNLATAEYIVSGAIVAYDADIQSGGSGLRIANIGQKIESRVDTITVNLRVVDVNSSIVLANSTVTQRVESRSVQGGALGYITSNKILEVESGAAINEPKTFALDAAFQAALLNLVTQMQARGIW